MDSEMTITRALANRTLHRTTRHHTRPTTRCTRCHDDDVRRTQLGTHRATHGTYRKAVLVGIKKKGQTETTLRPTPGLRKQR